jgi:hypothetical protein
MTIYGMTTSRVSQRFTKLAIDSFFENTKFKPKDLFILVDNDNSIDFKLDNRVLHIRNDTPQYFAVNANKVLKFAIENKADLVLMNNDIVLTPNWLDALEKYDNKITVPSCNEHIEMSLGGLTLKPAMELDEVLSYRKELDEISDTIISYPENRNKFVSLFRMGLYVMRIPYTISSIVGLMDEEYGRGGGEDIDYRIRTWKAGFDTSVVLDSFIIHFMGKSTWRSGESSFDTRKCEEQYQKHFLEKWGENITRVFLEGDVGTMRRFGVENLMMNREYKKVLDIIP